MAHLDFRRLPPVVVPARWADEIAADGPWRPWYVLEEDPEVGTKSGRVIGARAIIRWHRGVVVVVSPIFVLEQEMLQNIDFLPQMVQWRTEHAIMAILDTVREMRNLVPDAKA